MQTAEAVIRVESLNGVWETIGSDRSVGISAEGIQLQSNEWGADTASFTLKRDAGAMWPDLLAFTPVEIEIGGLLVWDGFISQTPTNEADGGSVNIQAKGWQYHLDDDSAEKYWVHSRLADWKDARSFPTTNLNYFRQGQTASSDHGAITLGWPDGSYLQTNCWAGIVLDLGEANSAASVSLTWEVPTGSTRLGSSANLKVSAKTSDSIASLTAGVDAFTPASMGATGSRITTGGTWAAPKRYVFIGMQWIGTAGAAAADYSIKILSISVGNKTTYYDSVTKLLTGARPSDTVKDTLILAPLLSQSTTSISNSAFTLPHMSAVDSAMTAREYMTTANSYEDNTLKIVPGRQIVFAPKVDTPSTSIGSWGGSRFSDASSNSSDELYNRVVVEGTGPDDQPLSISRYADSSSNQKVPLTSLLVNPSFEATSPSVVTNWASTGGSIFVRSTTTPLAGAASGQWSSVDQASTVTGLIFGGCPIFVAGRTYTLTIDVAPEQTYGDMYRPGLRFGDLASASNFAFAAGSPDWGVTTSSTVSITWVPSANVAAASVGLRLSAEDVGWYVSQLSGIMRVDTITLSYAASTMISRRGFTRTKRLQVNAPITATTAGILGDAFLATHSTTPLKGSVEVTAGGAREYTTGISIHPASLLLRTGEVLHLSHRVDPDTGAIGRDGRIASVSYDHSQQSSSIAIDSQRTRFEALLERLSVVTGTRLQK